jgi:hypothetical protein
VVPILPAPREEGSRRDQAWEERARELRHRRAPADRRDVLEPQHAARDSPISRGKKKVR